jgi:DNA-binding beta-propeller fold protein YncE
VAAVLGDAQRRVSILGGREGMPRSLGSVYGAAVTRFLRGGLRGVVSRVIPTPGVHSASNGVAVSRDGCTLLVSDASGATHSIHQFSVADGSQVRVIGGFRRPAGVYVARDGSVFVADSGNNRVQVLTPHLTVIDSLGVRQLRSPGSVCADVDADVVAVCESVAHRVSVLERRTSELLRQFGVEGSGDGQLLFPRALCLLGSGGVAVADSGNARVSVFTIEGVFQRHVGVGVLSTPATIACAPCDELLVGDSAQSRLFLFSATGELLASFGGVAVLGAGLAGVTIHNGTVFAHSTLGCTLFT